MTQFINRPHSDHHQGADRLEAVIDAAQDISRDMTGKHGMALLIASALAAAVMAVAYEVMDSNTESHLLMLWIVLWMALFAALTLSAGRLHSAGTHLKSSLDSWSRSLAEARADQRLWAIAKQDNRVMADLQAAMDRSDDSSDVFADMAGAGSAAAPGQGTQAARAKHAFESKSSLLQRGYL